MLSEIYLSLKVGQDISEVGMLRIISKFCGTLSFVSTAAAILIIVIMCTESIAHDIKIKKLNDTDGDLLHFQYTKDCVIFSFCFSFLIWLLLITSLLYTELGDSFMLREVIIRFAECAAVSTPIFIFGNVKKHELKKNYINNTDDKQLIKKEKKKLRISVVICCVLFFALILTITIMIHSVSTISQYI